MPVFVGGLEGRCNDCSKVISGDITFKADTVGPIRVLAFGTIVSAASAHHNDPEMRKTGKEHSGFVLDTTESGLIRTIGIITAAAGETNAVAMIIDEEIRKQVDAEMVTARGVRGA